MKTTTTALLILISVFLGSVYPLFAADKVKRYQGAGEVLSVDPLYGQITIKHGPIKGFIGGGDETLFFVSSKDLLKGINKRDLVDFSLVDAQGDAQIDKITKTGVAPPKKNESEVGNAVQGIITATGEVVKTVTSPIEPAHEVVSGTMGATTHTTGALLDDATLPETKKQF